MLHERHIWKHAANFLFICVTWYRLMHKIQKKSNLYRWSPTTCQSYNYYKNHISTTIKINKISNGTLRRWWRCCKGYQTFRSNSYVIIIRRIKSRLEQINELYHKRKTINQARKNKNKLQKERKANHVNL